MSGDGPPPSGDPLGDLDRSVSAAVAAQAERDAAERAVADRAKSARAASAAWRIVIDLVVATALGLGLGVALDAAAGTRPFGLIIGVVFGFGAAMWLAVRWSKRLQAAPPPRNEE